MSLIKSATRRLSLLAGSSLAIAGMAALGSAGVALMPTAAYAYDECAPVAGTGTQSDGPNGLNDPTINGNAPDTFQCITSMPATITYNSVGTTGLLTISTVGTPTGSGRRFFGGGIVTNPGGDVAINVGIATGLGASNRVEPGLNLTSPTGATTTVNIADYAVDNGYINDALVSSMRAVGGGNLVVNNDGLLIENIDFVGVTGDVTLNVLSKGLWWSGGAQIASDGGADATTVLGLGDDTVNVDAGGMLWMSRPTNTAGLKIHTIEFQEGAGDADVLNNEGHIVTHFVGATGSENPKMIGSDSETRLTGLETFNNSGVIFLGAVTRGTFVSEDTTPDQLRGDGWNDDVLSIPGATFVGADGRIFFDVNYNSGSQTDCTTRTDTGDLPAADCLMIVGGATEGRTFVVLNDVQSGDRGAYNPEGIVIVDVSGGTSAQGHFVIDPASDGYSTSNGGVIDKGIFFYGLAYNEDTQQQILVGLPGDNALQQSLLVGTAQGLWRLSTGSWLERQADLRVDPADGFGGGVWLRVLGETAERDMVQAVEGGGQTFTFDNTFEQKSYAVTGGLDVMSGSDGNTAYVAGVMVGYANSELAYETSPNEQRFNGWTGGLYASLISGGLFVDAALNANKLTLRQDIPTLGIEPAGTLVSTDLISVGGQIEAGYRFPILEGAFVEPLANLSYVRTTFDDIEFVPDDPTRVGATAEFEDPTSLRAGIGARVGLDQDYGGFSAQYSLLGRLWNEFEGENSVVFHNLGDDATVLDDFSGQFTEVTLGVSLFSGNGAVSGFANVGGKFGDDYQAKTASVGVRVNW